MVGCGLALAALAAAVAVHYRNAAAVLLASALLGGVVMLLWREVGRRERVEAQVRADLEQLESRVAARTGELGAANAALRAEVAARDAAQAAERRVHRRLRVLTECHKAIIRSTSAADLVRDVCRILVGLGAYRQAWVGLAEDDAGQTVRPAAQAGDARVLLTDGPITWGDDADGRGPTGTAIRTGQPCVVRDLVAGEGCAPWQAAAVAADCTAAAAAPLAGVGRTLGALTVYATAPDAFDDAAVQLLTELGRDLAYGLTALAARAHGAESLRALSESEPARLQREHLEELLETRTAEAEAANRAKSAFLASMSHEIRTPMNAILGFAQLMLRDDALTPVQRRHLDTIDRSGAHLLALIDDILEISKIEAGRVTLNPTTFDLRALLANLELMLRVRAAERRLMFSVDLQGDVPRSVVGDEGKLRQVLINLLGNAVKFTDHGGVVLRARVTPDQTGGLRLAAEVEDTGPGIPPEEASRLFQPFEQAAIGRRAPGGTGLGLAISRAFVRLMGGDLTVASVPGSGSTFRFEVPLAEGGSAAETAVVESRPVRRLAPGQPARRVLIADDRDDNRAFLVALLTTVGFETREVTDGEAAVREVLAWQPHLVLMDTHMPGLDGFAAMRAIRAAPGGAETKIMSVSASAFADNRREALAAGADDFIGKPFREGLLFEKLRALLAVEYEYGAAPPAAAASGAAPTLTRAALAPLPAPLVDELRAAVVGADLDRLLALLDEITALPAPVVAELRRLAQDFEYDRLAELLGAAG